jgi:hypothetical protein
MEYIWKVANLKRIINTGFVIQVVYVLTGTVGSRTEGYIGTVCFKEEEPPVNFIPFEDLTEEIVLQWVYDFLTPERINTMLQSMEQTLHGRPEGSYIIPYVDIDVPW